MGQPQVVVGQRQRSSNLSSGRLKRRAGPIAGLWSAVYPCCTPKLFCLAGLRRHTPASAAWQASSANISCCNGSAPGRIDTLVRSITALLGMEPCLYGSSSVSAWKESTAIDKANRMRIKGSSNAPDGAWVITLSADRTTRMLYSFATKRRLDYCYAD